jgi:polyferredoxin
VPEELKKVIVKKASAEVTSVDVMTQATNNLKEEDVKDIVLDRLKWENRRKMAWVFIYAIITFVFLNLLVIVAAPKDIFDRLVYSTDLLTWLFMGLLSIPSLYFGGTVIEKFTGVKKV